MASSPTPKPRKQAALSVLRARPSGSPEIAQRGCGRQHEAEQLRSDDVKALISEVQAADRVVLAQPLDRNPEHLATRCTGHSCEQELARRLTLALVDAAAQGRTAKGVPLVRSAQRRLLYPLRPFQLDPEAVPAEPRQLGHLTHHSDCLMHEASVLELLDV